MPTGCRVGMLMEQLYPFEEKVGLQPEVRGSSEHVVKLWAGRGHQG